MGIRIIREKSLARRVMRLDIDVDMFLHVLSRLDGKRRLETVGLPTEVRVIGTTTDRTFNTVSLLLESPDFDEVPEGYVAPDLNLTFREFYGEAHP